MFESFAELFPANWRPAILVLTAPFRWLAAWQGTMLRWIFGHDQTFGFIAGEALLIVPILLICAGTWSSAASLYTVPFRSGRGRFLTLLLMTWWDAGRCILFFYTGMVRVLVAFLGWIIGSVRFGLRMIKSLIIGIVRLPITVVQHSSRAYFEAGGMPWVAFLILMLWSAVEATIFTFTLQPTLNEVFGGLTGFEPNPRVMAPMLWLFLFMLVAGSFACVHVMAEAIKNRKWSNIISMGIVESAVMFFEVVFLYRELIDAITPWIAQQSGGSVQLGIGATLALASFGWMGVRGMSWFLFGRFGTPALIAILSRQHMEHGNAPRAEQHDAPELWRAPIEALKAETKWFHEEAKRMFELLSLPVLQLFASALNFAVVAVQSRPMFMLPFKSLDDVLHATPGASGKPALSEHSGSHRTPRDPMARVA
ncbi:MAG TPA: hypothetical protein VH539_11420 [Gemmatimonadaceae bacterium]|jgi:hypothetical protein